MARKTSLSKTAPAKAAGTKASPRRTTAITSSADTQPAPAKKPLTVAAARRAFGPPPQVNEKIACFKLVVKPSKIHRWGLYAGEFIPRRRKIIEYTGEKVNRKETKRRAEGPLNYLFTLNSYWCIDGSVGGSGAEYINHCCEPNCYAWVHQGHILYMSLRDIEPGEELTIDYHFDKDVEKVPCRCGAKHCRGTINLLE